MESRAGSPSDHAVLRGVCDARRRRVLRLLRDLASPVAVDELATLLAAAERDVAPDDVTLDDVRSRRTDLVHNHLPRLEGAGLVSWERGDGAVATTDHPALSNPTLNRILADPAGDWDPVLENLADDRRRCVLAVLRDHGGVMDRCELAKRVVERERQRRQSGAGESDDRDESEGDADRNDGDADRRDDGRSNGGGRTVAGGRAIHANDAVLSLHHVHIPKLERVGLLAYDAEDGTVSYQADSTLADDLLGEAADESAHSLVSSA